MQVNMHEAKSQLSKLGEKAREGETIVIAKAGKPYLDLIPHQSNVTPRQPGRFMGQIVISKDFDETPSDIIDAFELQCLPSKLSIFSADKTSSIHTSS